MTVSAGRPQDWMKASRSALMTSACVVGMPCGKPAYVFSVPFWTSWTARGPEPPAGPHMPQSGQGYGPLSPNNV